MRHGVLLTAAVLSFAIASSAVRVQASNPAQSLDELVTEAREQPHNLQTRRSLGKALFKKERFAEAAEQFKQLLVAGSKDASDEYWLAESYYRLSKYDSAISAFTEAVRLNPKLDVAKVRLIESRLAMKDRNQAQRQFTEYFPTVTDPQAKKQLEIMGKITFKKGPLCPDFKSSGPLEVPPNGKN